MTHVDHRTFGNGERWWTKTDVRISERGHGVSNKYKIEIPIEVSILTLYPYSSACCEAARPYPNPSFSVIAVETELRMPMHDRELLVCSTIASLGSSGVGEFSDRSNLDYKSQ